MEQMFRTKMRCRCLVSAAILALASLFLMPESSAQNTTPETAKASLQNKNRPKIKPGSKDDVQAIGNRNIGGTNWYSLEKEIVMGREYAQMVDSSAKMARDPIVTEYVNRIGQNLVRNSDAKVPFTIKVIDSSEINAFALPGGFLYVNTGLVLAADEEAELASVMAHEIAHVSARHATRQMTRANIVNIASIPLIFVGGGLGVAVRSAVGLGVPLSFLQFSRGFEAEADYLDLQYMYKTGYDPQAFIAFFEKLQSKEKKKPGSLSKAFSSHPPIPDRIRNSQREIATVLPVRERYVVSTSEFSDVKGRVAALENRQRFNDGKESRPTLRRQQRSEGATARENDRPTLKRR